MALTAGDIRPLMEVRLFDPGEADPRVTDRGFCWYDILAQSHALGEFSRDSRGDPWLEFLPEIGLTCRARFLAQHTRQVDWLISGGSWEERFPSSGRYRTLRLCQYDTSPGVQYVATSLRYQTANPAFVVSLRTSDTPPDWNPAVVEPFVEVEFGAGVDNGRFKLRLDKDGRCYLCRWDTDRWEWQWAMDLPTPQKGGGYSDGEELFLAVRCKRGRVGVSTDCGAEWKWYGSPGTIYVPSARVTVRGAGGEVDVGLHALAEQAGSWLSPRQPTLMSAFFGTALITGRFDRPPGSSVTYTDVSTVADALARYRVDLAPNAYGESPTLYATTFRYLCGSVPGSGDYETPWTWTDPDPKPTGHGLITEVRISRPQSLRGAACTLKIKLAPGDVPLTSLRRRKIVVRIGYRAPDGSGGYTDHWWTAFTGYVGTKEAEQSSFGEGWQTVVADAAAHWTRTKWWPTDVIPLGGNWLNDANDFILSTEGIAGADLPQYRAWHDLGNYFRLDAGFAEEPFELLRPTEPKWETLERINAYAGLELGIDDVGALFTLRKNPDGVPATTGVSHDYKASGTNDLEKLIGSVRNRTDYDQSGTAIMVSGRSQWDGTAMRAYGVDVTAETDPDHERFCPWREDGPDGQQEVSDPCGPGLLLYKAGEAAYQLFPIKAEPDLSAFLNRNVSRRDTIRVYGCEDQDIPDGAAHVVMTADDTVGVDLESGDCTLETTLGLYRIPT